MKWQIHVLLNISVFYPANSYSVYLILLYNYVSYVSIECCCYYVKCFAFLPALFIATAAAVSAVTTTVAERYP